MNSHVIAQPVGTQSAKTLDVDIGNPIICSARSSFPNSLRDALAIWSGLWSSHLDVRRAMVGLPSTYGLNSVFWVVVFASH